MGATSGAGPQITAEKLAISDKRIKCDKKRDRDILDSHMPALCHGNWTSAANVSSAFGAGAARSPGPSGGSWRQWRAIPERRLAGASVSPGPSTPWRQPHGTDYRVLENVGNR
jgi:hypothetical protein